jgi:hypothetical protein
VKEQKLTGKRYIALARCSTKGQADTSIEDQLRVINAYARTHEMIFVDSIRLEGVTGSVPGARSDIDELIARKNDRDDFEVVVVHDTTRLTRSGPLHAANIRYQLAAAGIELVFAADDIPEGDNGFVAEMLLNMSGRQQAKSISMSSARGSMSSILQGRSAHCRRTPYGLDKLYLSADGQPNHIIRNLPDGTQVMLDPETRAIKQTFKRNEQTGVPNHYNKQKDERVNLIPGDEQHVAVVQRIYRLYYVERWGYTRIARALNDDGIPSPTGKSWYVATVRSILLNTVYGGHGIANRFSSAIYHERSPESPNAVRLDAKTLAQGKRPPTRIRPRSDWHERHEPAVNDLLDPEIKAMARKKQDQNLEDMATGRNPVSNRDRHRDSPYLLKDILISKQGGYRMTGQASGRAPYRRRYYRVSKAYSTPRSADAVLRRSIPAEPLEECVVAVVQGMLLRAPHIRDRIKDTIRKQLRETVKDDADLAKLRKRRDSVVRQIEFAMEELSDLGREAVKRKVKKLEAELETIDKEIHRAQPVVELNGEDVEAMADAVIERIAELARSMDQMPHVDHRRLLEAVVHRAVVDLETRNVELELHLPVWLLDSSKPMCLDATFGCKYDIETHHENAIPAMKIMLSWSPRARMYLRGDYGLAA